MEGASGRRAIGRAPSGGRHREGAAPAKPNPCFPPSKNARGSGGTSPSRKSQPWFFRFQNARGSDGTLVCWKCKPGFAARMEPRPPENANLDLRLGWNLALPKNANQDLRLGWNLALPSFPFTVNLFQPTEPCPKVCALASQNFDSNSTCYNWSEDAFPVGRYHSPNPA